MSNIYIQEPPTNGKVLLYTTCGEIEIELWSKEAPKACRNFVQLCLEGYYDGTIFHRIVKGFCVQGGDPTGTGMGGESIYGHPFKDEIHQRLRFVRRGLVAMANAGPNDNHSQFFFTLGAAVELHGKHTIFAKIAGNTIYNMLKMEECEVDRDDRPLFPPQIKKTEVLYNPFDDIVPRVTKMEMKEKPADEKKRKVKGTKNFSLLSFGEEAEDDENQVTVASAAKKLKMKSSHDVLDDPSLSAKPVVDAEVHALKKDKNELKSSSSDEDSGEEIDERDFDTRMRDQVREKLKKRKYENEEEEEPKMKDQSERSKELRAESKRLQKELMESSRKRAGAKEKQAPSGKDFKGSDVLAAFHAEQLSYLEKKKRDQKRKGEGRDTQTSMLLADFQSKLDQFAEGDEKEVEDDDNENDTGWMFHSLVCESQEKLAKDASVQDEDTFEIYDPRNPINKRRREASKKAMKERRR